VIAELTLHLRANALLVPLARRQISALLENSGVAQDDILRAEVVVTEACSNVVMHAYRGRTGKVFVRAEYQAERVVLTVSDVGLGFDAGAVPSPEVGQVGGYGIYFIRRMADAVAITSSPQGITVVAEISLRYRDATYLQMARSLDAEPG